jgi:polar amino acid transport system permease protein
MTVIASFSWAIIWDNRSALLHGLLRTLQVSAIGIVGSFAIGAVLGAARAHRVPVISQLAAVYVEVIRNTPILVQIFMPFQTAWLAVTIWGGAFNTENFRAGFEAVPFRYREAGLALGFGRIATFFQVTFPIGSRIALPSSLNTYVSVLKNTALMTAIGFPELTSTARSIAAATFRDAEMLAVTAVIYLAIVWLMSGLIRGVERFVAIPEEAL